MSRENTPFRDYLIGPCPCDGCPVEPKCAGQPIACEDFAVYVNENRVCQTIRWPTGRIFSRIFKGAA